MATSYQERRRQIEAYFDRTAAEAWSRLTSDAPLGRVRATVRAGRDEMRNTLLSYLPEDLSGRRLLDAGCGTGALSVLTARRGAEVVAIDLSPTLVGLAKERLPEDLGPGSVDFQVGDLLDAALGRFDYVVCMDSLIHYQARDMVAVLAGLAPRVEKAIVFTFAPKTVLLTLMHAVGGLFPRGDRSPAIEPVAEAQLRALLQAEPALKGFTVGRSKAIARGFYISQALELTRQ